MLLKAVLIFSVIIVFGTEVLSAFYLVKYPDIVFFWVGVLIVNITLLFSKRSRVLPFLSLLKQRLKVVLSGFKVFEKVLLLALGLLLILVFIQGICYPPNNWDSMTYHLARIAHWISNQSVEHYSTNIFRQVYQPPFSEYVIMHFNILSGNDYFSNTVQFFFLLFLVPTVLSIINLLGLKRKYKFIAVVLLLTIPEVILQASSTQNDIVVSFFILTSVYFCIECLKNNYSHNYLFFGISVGLAFLTKGTAYIYLFPLLLIFTALILRKLYRTKQYVLFLKPFLAAFICLSINFGHYNRNYSLTKSILGVDKVESKLYSNESMSPSLLLANMIKNSGLHFGPYPINKASNYIINRIANYLNLDLNNPDINFNKSVYKGAPSLPNHEDRASNPIHYVLMLLSLIILFVYSVKNKGLPNKVAFFIFVVLVLQVVLFNYYLKWQPWHSRLHTPMFILSIPLICYVSSLGEQYYRVLIKLLSFIIIYALILVLINKSRPFISNKFTFNICITDTRFQKYFANRIELYNDYKTVLEKIKANNYKNIGLVMDYDDWEYPLFICTNDHSLNPIHINVSNITKNISRTSQPIDCIVSTNTSDSIIFYNGKGYYKQNVSNSFINIYKEQINRTLYK